MPVGRQASFWRPERSGRFVAPGLKVLAHRRQSPSPVPSVLAMKNLTLARSEQGDGGPTPVADQEFVIGIARLSQDRHIGASLAV